MTRRRRIHGQAQPDEVQEFIDWSEHQYLGSTWYHGGRLPPMAVMVVGAWTTAVLLVLNGSVIFLVIVADALGGGQRTHGSSVPDSGSVALSPYEVIVPLGMVLLGVWIMRRLRRRGRAR